MREDNNDVQSSMKLKRRTLVALILPTAVAIALLWIPFGFSLHGLIEEWDVLGIFTISGPVLFVQPHTLLEAHRLRPLTVFPHALGYMLNPDSFDAWHWILIAILLVKGATCAYIGACITRSLRWGALFGLLVLLYPADTMQLSFRSQHINMSMALILLGSAMLVHAQTQAPGWSRRLGIAAAAIFMLAAQLMYEVALMLCMLPLLVQWCRHGFVGAWQVVRKNPWPTLAWLTAAVSYVFYVLYASASGGDSYQQTITDRHAPFAALYRSLPRLFDTGFARALAGGWLDAWGMARKEFTSPWYLLAFGGICALCVLLSPRSRLPLLPGSETMRQDGGPPLLRMAAMGVVLLALGYVPFMFSNSHLQISQRTFLFASFGAALVVLVLVIGLGMLLRPLGGVVALWLLSCGAAAQLFQFHHYIDIAEAQRKVLRTIVENYDADSQGHRSLLILDHSNQLAHVWMLRDNLVHVLTYLYGRPIAPPEICLMPGGYWQRMDGLNRPGRCIEGADEWSFTYADAPSGIPPPQTKPFARPKSQMQPLVIDIDGHATGDPALDGYRQRLQEAETPVARRYRAILRQTPAGGGDRLGLFKPAGATASYRWDFGTWWSLEKPTRGNGWHEAEWMRRHLRYDAAAWKSQEHSRLLFPLESADKPYVLSGRFDIILSAAIQSSLRVQVNGVDLPITWGQDLRFVASVPRGALRTGINTIEFDSLIDPAASGLSARLSEFEVRPTRD
ncbi:hypothetical protein H6CHR_00769 [Variovorax sp. PBL-H6]|uniref:hypothetical protein n=1 Tax=Variovorax sp. PBL-H6 TaxID=434009 RepID=UPI0013187776|nr:hypothetical protein [Variovorax sp. PBL-H6]VTU17414.1 hypothetical protein H6CHR_00769 [Variovorax sp. PBL-H6]